MKKRLALSIALAAMASPAGANDARDADFLVDVMNLRLETQRTGIEEAWYNSITGNGGNVTILSTDDSNPEMPCRTYRLTTEVIGQAPIVIEGRGCRIGPRIWQRTEFLVTSAPAARPDPAPEARADPPEPPPVIAPPLRKPDPKVFYATIPTPSSY